MNEQMNEQMNERLRSYYQDLQTEPSPALAIRVTRAFAASPAPQPARALRRPLLALGAAAAVVIVLIATLLARSLGPGPSPSGLIGPSDSPAPSGSTSVTPSASIPTQPSLPAGRWTGLEWTVLPEGSAPVSPAPVGGAGDPDLFGWRGGYVDFIWDGQRSVVPWVSTNARHWRAGQQLPPGELPFTRPTSDQWCDFQVDSFVEAPSALLVHARMVCEGADAGGPGSMLYSATWTSTDGLTWTPASNVPNGELSLGGAGWLVSDGERLWTSADGSSWTQGKLPNVALPQGMRWGHPIAFAGGFLLAPVAGYGQQVLDPRVPAATPTGVYWSADGLTWSRQDPPGARSGLSGLWLDKIDDNLLLLREATVADKTGKSSTTAWTSVDGRAWKPMATWTGIDPLDPGSKVAGVLELNGEALTGLGHTIVVHYDQGMSLAYGFDPAARGAYDLRQTLSPDTLYQTQGYPPFVQYGHGLAIGPAGLLATDGDGLRFSIGVPTAEQTPVPTPTPRPAGLYPTGALSPALTQTTATLLADGRVLIAGGMQRPRGGDVSVRSAAAEIYDPATGKFTPTGSMNEPRVYSTATLLGDGRVLVTGGADLMDGIDNQKTAEVYDPATGKWTRTGSMTRGRAEHTATMLPDGRVLITGGYGGGTLPTRGAELYDPTTGKFTATGSLKVARSGHTATLLPNGQVLIAGGQTDLHAGMTSSAELYDPSTRSFTATGSMASARWAQSAVLLEDGTVLVAGGYGPASSAAMTGLKLAEIFDPGTGKFTAAAPLPVASDGTLAALLADGRALVTAGRTVCIYDPGEGTFTTVGTADAQMFTATLLADGEVLLTEGSKAQLYQP